MYISVIADGSTALSTRQLCVPTVASFGQRSTQHCDLPLHHLQARPADRFTPLDARLEIEDGLHVVPKLVAQLLVVCQGQLVQLAAPRLGQCNCASRDVVCLAERYLRPRSVCDSVSETRAAHPFAH